MGHYDEYRYKNESSDRVEIMQGDCMDYMAKLEDNAFDLAIVDPPYGINVTKMNMGGRSTIKPDNNKKWDSHIPSVKYFNELFRVSKNQIIWGGNYFNLPPSQYFAIWDKGETMYGRDFAECEFAWVRSGGTRIFKKNPNDKFRIHPTQKPVDLYSWLLTKYAKENMKVLDTHLGSGSSAIAAYYFGCDFVGIELDEGYYKSAKQRFEQTTAQQALF